MGRARNGKSFLISILAKSRKEHNEVFCSNGKDKTVCPVQNVFIDVQFNECFEFHTDFNSIYKSEDENEELQELKESVSSVLGKQYYFEDDDAKTKMEAIEEIIRQMRVMESRYEGRKASDTYISVYLRPGGFLRDIMREASLRRVEVMDTPGVSGEIAATKLSKADLYIIILKRSILSELAKLLKKSVKDGYEGMGFQQITQ